MRHRGVRLRLLQARQRPQIGHGYAMYLTQPARRRRQRQSLLQRAAIGDDRIDCIAAAQAEIETLKRGAETPGP
jgi:hypothetical protein